LVVNQAAYKRRRADLQDLLDAFSKVWCSDDQDCSPTQ
jgi:hypothetical protein